MKPVNFGDQLQVIDLLPVAAVTATGNATSVDLQALDGEIAIIMDSAAGTGTTPTLNVKLQDSDDNSAFADVSGAAFTQVAASASVQKMSINKDEIRRYVRIVKTVGGTTPSFLVSIKGVGLMKYPA
jgi:hypothetical protein